MTAISVAPSQSVASQATAARRFISAGFVSVTGHSRPLPPIMPAGSRPRCSKSDPISSAQPNDAKCQDRDILRMGFGLTDIVQIGELMR
jgi:hypothetical protein